MVPPAKFTFGRPMRIPNLHDTLRRSTQNCWGVLCVSDYQTYGCKNLEFDGLIRDPVSTGHITSLPKKVKGVCLIIDFWTDGHRKLRFCVLVREPHVNEAHIGSVWSCQWAWSNHQFLYGWSQEIEIQQTHDGAWWALPGLSGVKFLSTAACLFCCTATMIF